MATEWVRMYHPGIKGTALFPAKAAPGWLTRGWKPVRDELPKPPPKAGKGSGRNEWAAHAALLGVAVSDDDSRDDIAAAVDKHLADHGDHKEMNNDG